MKRLALTALFAVLASAARAGDVPSAIAHEISQKFISACEAGKLDNALALYADDAVVVFPSQGARAETKEQLAKLLADNCGEGVAKSKWLGGRGTWFGTGENTIVASGAWETSGVGPNGAPISVIIRTTELLVKTPAGWKYRIDHASIGLPAPAPAAAPSAPPSP